MERHHHRHETSYVYTQGRLSRGRQAICLKRYRLNSFSPDIFQEKMNKLFAGFDYVRVYIDDLLIITKGSFEEYPKQLDTVLENFETAGLKINASKWCFPAHELEYLGYWISRDGIKPLASKVEAIKKWPNPKTGVLFVVLLK